MIRSIPDRAPDGFRTYIRAIHRLPQLDRKQELALARRFQRKGDQDAGRKIVEGNLRWVPPIASKYVGYGIPLPDLVEEGNLGLLEAVRRFDPSRKLRVMTYATFWIRAYIRAFIVKQWSLVGVGSSSLHAKMFFRLRGERARLMLENADRNSVDVDVELAELFRTTPRRVRVMTNRLGGRDASLDGVVSEEGAITMLDLLADTTPDSEHQTAAAERGDHVRRELAKAYDRLDARERLIVESRLMATDEEATLADLGRQLGLTRERVRQLEARVKMKLRTVLEPLVDARG